MKNLLNMLAYKRPLGSESLLAFEQRFIAPLGARKDSAGNWILSVGQNPTICWSSHTDSVHLESGMQKLAVAEHRGRRVIFATGSDCLGADDAAGVFLMTEMIQKGIKGLYIFHYGEEAMGIGSRYIASHTPWLFKGIKHCISLDRGGYSSVITHQMGERCCSDAFARSLANRLNAHGCAFKLDRTGVFTDSANYMDIVPECTNISVGYYNQHTPNEYVDLYCVEHIRHALLNVNFSRLPCRREVESW